MSKNLQPTIFYAQWPGVKDDDLIVETNQLGRIDYLKTYPKEHEFYNKAIFTKHQGWKIMETFISKNRTDILEATKFFTSTGKQYTLEKLFSSLQNVEFRR
jgi:hypothetical protein